MGRTNSHALPRGGEEKCGGRRVKSGDWHPALGPHDSASPRPHMLALAVQVRHPPLLPCPPTLPCCTVCWRCRCRSVPLPSSHTSKLTCCAVCWHWTDLPWPCLPRSLPHFRAHLLCCMLALAMSTPSRCQSVWRMYCLRARPSCIASYSYCDQPMPLLCVRQRARAGWLGFIGFKPWGRRWEERVANTPYSHSPLPSSIPRYPHTPPPPSIPRHALQPQCADLGGLLPQPLDERDGVLPGHCPQVDLGRRTR